MRILLGTVFVLLLVLEGVAESDQGAASAGRSDPDEACHAVSPTGEVVVTTDGGGAVRATLMCVSDTGVWLLLDGHLSSVSLERVRRIRTPADPVWDGALKGAVQLVKNSEPQTVLGCQHIRVPLDDPGKALGTRQQQGPKY